MRHDVARPGSTTRRLDVTGSSYDGPMDASTGFSTAAPALALDVMLIALIASQTVSGARR